MADDEKITYFDRESAAISVEEGQSAVVLYGANLLSVEYVEVTHPDREDDICSIYGQIYVSNHATASEPHATLYNRTREKAETVIVGDSLSLSYDDSAAPVEGWYPIFVTMKLFEKKATPEEDTLIADIEDWEFDEFFDRDSSKRLFLHLKGESGFSFDLAYAIMNPAIMTEIKFKINKDICQDAAEAKQPGVGIYGVIHACQIIKDTTTALRLYYKGIDEAEVVNIGSLIDLDRKAIVVPVARAGALSIQYAFYSLGTELLIAEGRVPFFIKPLKSLDFIANESLIHTKDVENGLFSVSIKFIPCHSPIPLGKYQVRFQGNYQ